MATLLLGGTVANADGSARTGPPPDLDELAADLDHPEAIVRANARARLGNYILPVSRQRLDAGGLTPEGIITSIQSIARWRDESDIPRILRHVDSLDPGVAEAAQTALRAYGPSVFVHLRESPDLREPVRERMLRVFTEHHILRCGQRDQQVNPLRLAYPTRLAELYSVDADIDTVALQMLRDNADTLREEVQGHRLTGSAFMQHGGLAVVALAERRPEVLLAELADLRDPPEFDPMRGSFVAHSAVTREVAIFLARQGHPGMLDMIAEMFRARRWGRPHEIAAQHLETAALQYTGLGQKSEALALINEHIGTLSIGGLSAAGNAHYLRARILVDLGEFGTALRALEDAMEATQSPPLLVLVDDSFAPLAGDRRFTVIRRFAELAERRVGTGSRPWREEQ